MIKAGPDDTLPADADDGLRTFQEAVQEQLALLRREIGLDAWMLTRVVGDDWTVLQMIGGRPRIEHGARFPWVDSICWRAVQGLGPSFCSSVSRLPAYASAPLRELLDIETYLGVALLRRGGELFGTLCGINSIRREFDLEFHRKLLSDVACALATMIEREFEIAHESRLAGYSLMRDSADPDTDTVGETQWRQLLVTEEATRQALLSPASVLAVSAAGKTRAARALRRAVGPDCMLAKLGARQIVALVPDCDSAQAEVLRARACGFLADGGLPPLCRAGTAMGGCSLTDATQRAARSLEQDSPGN